MTALQLKPFSWRSASEAGYAALNRFRNEMRKEWYPDDPPVPLDEEVSRLRNTPAFIAVHAWSAWRDGEMIALAHVDVPHLEENQHLAEFSIEVLPAWRRQGLARQLLPYVVEAARGEARSLLLAWTKDTMPSGEAFMQRLGAQRGLVERVSQLTIADVNRDLIRQWIARAPERAAGFELLWFEGAPPDEYLLPIADLINVMNDAPRGSLAVEDEQNTPERIRERERAWQARGLIHWTLIAREQATGKLAGFTETFWHPNRPHLLQQGGTGVWPQYRNKGLGRCLKAAMIERVLRERAQVRVIRTDNAETNAAMLNINYQLGFKHAWAQSGWQIETEQIEAYLANSY